MDGPIANAHLAAVGNRLLSMIYSALNSGRSERERRRFRKEWQERGSSRLEQLLLQCSRADWGSYPEAFWVDPWIGRHLQAIRDDGGSFCYILDMWLKSEPLPAEVDEDPYVEDRKVKHLEELYRALNR